MPRDLQTELEPEPDAPMIDGRLLARRLSTLLLGCALALALYTPATMALGEVRARQTKTRYENDLRSLQRAVPAPHIDTDGNLTYHDSALALGRKLRHGRPFARIQIPRLGIDEVVVAGSRELSIDGEDSALQSGPAFIRESELPGLGSNTAIAGHRTTWTRPFWALAEIRRGDKIRLTVPYGTFTYEVTGTEEVLPFRSDVVEDHHKAELTLSTCTPRFTAQKRLIVHAREIRDEPRDVRRSARPKEMQA